MFQQKFKRCLRPILDQMLGVCNSPWDIPYIFFLNSSKVLYWADKAGSCPWGGVPAPAWSLQIYGAPVPDWSTWVPLRGYLVGSFRNSQPSLEYSWAFEGATNRADITIMMPKVQDSQMWKLSFGGAGSWGYLQMDLLTRILAELVHGWGDYHDLPGILKDSPTLVTRVMKSKETRC